MSRPVACIDDGDDCKSSVPGVVALFEQRTRLDSQLAQQLAHSLDPRSPVTHATSASKHEKRKADEIADEEASKRSKNKHAAAAAASSLASSVSAATVAPSDEEEPSDDGSSSGTCRACDSDGHECDNDDRHACHADPDAMVECVRQIASIPLAGMQASDIDGVFVSFFAHGWTLPARAFFDLCDDEAWQASNPDRAEEELLTTAAHWMAEQGEVAVLQRLLEHNAAIASELSGPFPSYTRRPARVTPIFYAVCSGELKAFDVLNKFEPHFDINGHDAHGRAPILLTSSTNALREIITRFRVTLVLPPPMRGDVDSHPLAEALCARDWDLCLQLLLLELECSVAAPILASDGASTPSFFERAIEAGATDEVLAVMLGHDRNALAAGLLAALRQECSAAQIRIVRFLAHKATWLDFQTCTSSVARAAARTHARSMASDSDLLVETFTADAVFAAMDSIGVIEQAELEEEEPFDRSVLHLAATRSKELAKVLLLAIQRAWNEVHDLSDEPHPPDAAVALQAMLRMTDSDGATPFDAAPAGLSARSPFNAGAAFAAALAGLMSVDGTTDGISSPASEDEAHAYSDNTGRRRKSATTAQPLLEYRASLDEAWARIDAAASAPPAAASASSAEMPPYVVTVRGRSFNSAVFSNMQRRAERRKDGTGKDYLSHAAEQAASAAVAAAPTGSSSSAAAAAAGATMGAHLQSTLASLSSSGPLTLAGSSGLNRRVFTDANDCVQQVYTNSQSRMMRVLKEVHEADSAEATKDPLSRAWFRWLKPLGTGSNPFLSTSQLCGAKNAVLYAFGGSRDAPGVRSSSHDFRPKLTLDRSGVYFKRPVAGLLSMFFFLPHELEHGVFVLAMAKTNEISFKNPLQYAKAHEITVFGKIPGKNHRWQIPVMLPDFREAECPEGYQRWFGFTQLRYRIWRRKLVTAVRNGDSQARVLALVGRIAKHLTEVVEKLANALAAEEGAALAFIGNQHQITKEPPPAGPNALHASC